MRSYCRDAAARRDRQEKLHFSATVRLASTRRTAPATPCAPPERFALDGGAPSTRFSSTVRPTGFWRARRSARRRRSESWPPRLPPNSAPAGSRERMAPRLIELCLQTAGAWEIHHKGRLALPHSIAAVTAYRQEAEASGSALRTGRRRRRRRRLRRPGRRRRRHGLRGAARLSHRRPARQRCLLGVGRRPAMLHWLLQTVDDHPSLARGIPPRGVLNAEEQGRFAALPTEKRRRDWLLGRWTAKRLVQQVVAAQGLAAPAAGRYRNRPQSQRRTARGRPCAGLVHQPSAGCRSVRRLARAMGAAGRRPGTVESRAASFAADYFTAAELAAVSPVARRRSTHRRTA